MAKIKLKGKIVSLKMAKTAVVLVEKIKKHPKYKKNYRFHLKYKAHCPTDDYREGDLVFIEECRPVSKDKKWLMAGKVIEGANQAAGAGKYVDKSPLENNSGNE